MTRPRRLLTMGHSYAVALNRRLALEMQREGRGRWEITAAAPGFVQGELRPIPFEPDGDQAYRLKTVEAYLTRWPHIMFYGRRLRHILREPWDLVHCWQEPYIFSGGQAARWTPKEIPLVFTTYQNMLKRYPPPFSWIENYCMNRCAGWVTGGQTVIETMTKRGYSAIPHRLIPLGIDLQAYRPDADAGERVRRALGWDAPGPPVVGYLGRFVPEKGPIFLARVLERMTSPCRVLFVGGGVLEAPLRQCAARLGSRARIVTGVAHQQVCDYLNAMDILCAPSQTAGNWREQFGRMITEAFACGVPVIGSDSGEIPHVIGDAGIVVGEKDEAAWARALSELLDSSARRKELSARGRDRARRLYSWPVVARMHLDFFDQVLSS